MNSTGDGKLEPSDPEVALRMAELELMRQRAVRQAAKPFRGLRAASLIFFILVVVGTLIACYVAFSDGGLDKFRARNTPQSSATEEPVQPTP
jgi:hypothetical protein